MPLRLANCLRDIYHWMTINKLCLNGNKTEVMIVGKGKTDFLQNWPTELGLTPNPKDKVTVLGVILDGKLSMIPQVRQSVSRASHFLRLIRKAKHLLTQDQRKDLVQALIISRLDFSNGVLLGIPMKWSKKLQLVQNQAARLIYNLQKQDHISPVLKELHWLPVTKRVNFKILCLIYRGYHQLGPQFLSDLTPHYIPRRCLRSADKALLIGNTDRLISIGGKRIGSAGATLWNQIPLNIRISRSLYAFRKKLKTWLFCQAFQS